MSFKNYAYFLLVILLLLSCSKGFSQENTLWSKVDFVESSEQILPTNAITKKHQLFNLNINQLKNRLKFNLKSSNNSKVVELPDAEGNLVKFKVAETPILHPDLAKKFPSIKSYKGRGVNDGSLKVYFSISDLGFHAIVLSSQKGTMFIDPYTENREKYHVYYKKDVLTDKLFECSVEEEEIVKLKSKVRKKVINDLKLRTYRLALAATEEYSNFHVDAAGLGAGSARVDSISVVLSAMVVTMNRVNSIFERDLAITMQLIANNDQLIYLETDSGNDPYTNDNGSAMLVQNQNNINSVIGASNYDIGHVFSTGGGGVASLASVCGSNKAKGVTGSIFPVGDSFNIDYVAHEMGHQFGANHTFNGTAGNCGGGNRNDATAVEPGSGSSLMSYAGICGPQQNIQGNSDSYFHVVSIAEIYDNIINGGSCATVSSFSYNLNVPTANAGSDYVIPKSTPFVLKGLGSDLDGDVLTYCWEQIDNEVSGISIPPSSTQTVGAVFRSYSPTLESDRYFPDMQTLTSGGISTWEVLPDVSRTMNFALTVRDNVVGEGQTATDSVKITVTDAAGPFVVTSQNTTGLSWKVNDSKIINWDVAGTTANGINENNVNILLSLDGGLTFPVVLASNTPNDGTESIIVPNTPSPNARIMVQAVSNIFFAVNAENISIGSFETTCSTYQSSDVPKSIPDANTAGIVSTINVANNFLVSDVNVSLDISHSWLWDLQIYLKAPDGTEVLIYDRTCGSSGQQRENINATFDDGASAVNCSFSDPAISGTTKGSNLLSTFNGVSSLGNWQLKVVDNSHGDVGTLNNWSIELCQTNQTVGVDDYGFNEFRIYPNPFNNEIHLTFESNSSDDVLISLFDTTGRQVLRRKYANQTTIFDKYLNFSKISSGVYILKIQKGRFSTSKKIIKY
ncbi:T9SS C-terminal target domain-containing protein [Aureibaculum marinum]|uniref:T9SS C-terminal target domain-containing protein n=1 Tax=Aureibaculum marinum TaxID=2487930 RepID=A0A3N4NV21_9FLAO|nr:zinc-dependent metalloprotease family protein [Aureibaculum marinum]RPE00202.1 T9SS C-terminal target domain-containing protein [Aureibaculum marinum]